MDNSGTSSRNLPRSSRGSASGEPTLRNVVEENDAVFISTEENADPGTNHNSQEGSVNDMEGYNRLEFSTQRRLRMSIKYHFMDPWQKYKARGRKPWKLLIQILKIIIVTVQVYLFGSDRFSVVTFLEDNREALRFLFLKDYSGGGTSNLSIYTKGEVYSYLHYAHEKYYSIGDAIGSYDYTELDSQGSPPPVQLCYEYYKEASINTSTNIYKFDSRVISTCIYLSSPDGHHHIITNTSFNFGRLLSLRLNFILNAINLKGVKEWDKPACYQLNVSIVFDNVKRDGQMPVNLELINTWLECGDDSKIDSMREDSYIIWIALMAFDVFVILLCSISFFLCIRSLYKTVHLAREAREFFSHAPHEPLSVSDTMELFNWWFVLISISDLLAILGSIYKLAIDQKDSDYYDVCSLLLGLAVLLVWTGLLRFLAYFKQYNTLLLTVRASGPSVLRFCVCAGVLFLGFTFCGWIVIGPYNTKFRDTTLTAECLYSLVNGDDMFNTYAIVNPEKQAVWVYSKLYLYVFIYLFIYVVLSLFIGIIADTYERLKDMGELPPSRLHRFVEESGRPTDLPPTANATHTNHRHIHREPSTDSVIRRMSLDSTGVE